MTNWDKFREVFGIPENSKLKPIKTVCLLVKCVSKDCTECPIFNANVHGEYFWEDKYESKENNDDNRRF